MHVTSFRIILEKMKYLFKLKYKPNTNCSYKPNTESNTRHNLDTYPSPNSTPTPSLITPSLITPNPTTALSLTLSKM